MLRSVVQNSGDAEVSDFEVHVRIDEYILRLEIPMQYFVSMHEAHSKQHLQNPIGDQILTEVLSILLALLDMPRQILLYMCMKLPPQYYITRMS